MSLRPTRGLRLVRGAGWVTCVTLLSMTHAARSEPLTPPVEIDAQSVQGQAGGETRAEGDVRLTRGELQLQSDRLRYDQPSDRARAEGSVVVQRGQLLFRGPLLDLTVTDQTGFMSQPRFDLPPIERGLRPGGQADRIDFQGQDRFQFTRVNYTSCGRDGVGTPDWLIRADRLSVDLAANEGVVQGATLELLGAPVLPLPYLSFPVTDERKSGLLTPQFRLDSRSGLTLGLPYYLNLAPNWDATVAPVWRSRRGNALDGELRWLQPWGQGQIQGQWMPQDSLNGETRWGGRLQQQAQWDGSPWALSVDATRVSDADWWQDFPDMPWAGLTPRLLPTTWRLGRSVGQGRFSLPAQDAPAVDWSGDVWLGAQRWQVLQSVTDPMGTPYDRTLDFGGAWDGRFTSALRWRQSVGLNRFDRPWGAGGSTLNAAWRAHAVGGVQAPVDLAGIRIRPGLDWNAAWYQLDQALSDGRREFSRGVPTLSLDMGMRFDRQFDGWGQPWLQTLEPRVMWVRTPWREQPSALRFDSAARDAADIFAANDFSGVDRVADTHRLNVGAVTRLLDGRDGTEWLQLGLAQRFLLADQRITPNDQPIVGRTSDLLVAAGLRLSERWRVDSTLNYSQSAQEITQSVITGRGNLGDYRNLGLSHRYVRNGANQLDLFAQWPLMNAPQALWQSVDGGSPAGSGSSNDCSRRLYGIAKITYDQVDRRVIHSVAGMEMDAGCWAGRVVLQRQLAGLSQPTTSLMLEIELRGLSRAGGTVGWLTQNVPVYQPLR